MQRLITIIQWDICLGTRIDSLTCKLLDIFKVEVIRLVRKCAGDPLPRQIIARGVSVEEFVQKET